VKWRLRALRRLRPVGKKLTHAQLTGFSRLLEIKQGFFSERTVQYIHCGNVAAKYKLVLNSKVICIAEIIFAKFLFVLHILVLQYSILH
jgi:hypothetical protein